ncbi:MAG: hypothetical protein ACRDBO_21030 [Lachnospiraceae bacterium]
MASTNKTSLGLNMWEASDKPVRTDFNNDNSIIDGQIAKLNSDKAEVSHTHDDRYYTEAEVDTKLAAKSDTSHTHAGQYYTKVASGVADCLEQTTSPGSYIYGSGATNKPGADQSGGVILTIGYLEMYTLRFAITTSSELYVSIYRPGVTYGSWKQI